MDATFCPYKTLKVRKNSSKATITKAFRKLQGSSPQPSSLPQKQVATLHRLLLGERRSMFHTVLEQGVPKRPLPVPVWYAGDRLQLDEVDGVPSLTIPLQEQDLLLEKDLLVRMRKGYEEAAKFDPRFDEIIKGSGGVRPTFDDAIQGLIKGQVFPGITWP